MKKVYVALAALAVAAGATGASAGPNLVQNGSFSTTTPSATNGQFSCVSGQGSCPAAAYSVANWSAPAAANNYDFVFNPSNLTAQGYDGPVSLYSNVTASPDGGNFVGSDPVFNPTSGVGTAPRGGAITQTLTGLTKGASYTVTFDYAGSQQTGFSGATTEGWIVDFGGDPTQTTTILSNVSEGFTGWSTASMTFVADGTSDVLSFLATGGPATGGNLPPFALLDGVSVTANVPEPATWAMMLVGFAALGAGLRMRRRQAATAVA